MPWCLQRPQTGVVIVHTRGTLIKVTQWARLAAGAPVLSVAGLFEYDTTPS